MSLFRTRLSPALLAISSLALAFGLNAAEPALPLDVQQRLDALKTGFESFVLKGVTIPYDEGIKALNTKVKPALERESAAAAKRKDLDGLVRIKADIERTDKGLLLTEADSPPPDSLKNVYAAYKLELAKIESAKKITLADAKQRYDKGLSQIQDELTSAQKVEGALHVKQLREGLANLSDVAVIGGAGSASGLKEGTFANSLGMKFAPVPGTSILMCIHETRRGDFASYAKEAGNVSADWKNVMFEGTALSADDNDPVTMVSWDDSVGFCDWLSKKEGRKYRLPTDDEWSAAIGIASKESKTGTPAAKAMSAEKVYPWGGMETPPNGSGNYADAAFNAKFPNHFFIKGYSDGFATTAPVMKFQPNSLGIYDLGGNVWEWCSDWIDDAKGRRVGRGGSWYGYAADDLFSGNRGGLPPAQRRPYYGFRIVLSGADAAISRDADKDKKIIPTPALAPLPSGKSVLTVKKGQGISFFHDELEDIQCIRANQGEPVFEWIFGMGKASTEVKPDKGKHWLSKERDYWKYRSVNEFDKNNLAKLTSGEFWINKGESFYAERGGLTVRVTLLEPITRDLVILEIQPVRK